MSQENEVRTSLSLTSFSVARQLTFHRVFGQLGRGEQDQAAACRLELLSEEVSEEGGQARLHAAGAQHQGEGAAGHAGYEPPTQRSQHEYRRRLPLTWASFC